MYYDIIGDVHGNATKLKALLREKDYSESSGAFRHADRQALFVGDFIDRGDEQLETLEIARRMVDSGAALAVMGNHEFNAIAWATPDGNGDFLRPRRGETGKKNRKQHERFLGAVGEDSACHREWIDWFLTLPLWLDLPDLRVVHACWHPASMNLLARQLSPGNLLNELLLAPLMRKPGETAEADGPDELLYRAAETILKGLEIPLPERHSFVDKDGHVRKEARVRWWDPSADTFPKAAITSEEDPVRLPDLPIPAHARLGYSDEKPVFIGHYWLQGAPEPRSGKVACLDYSVGRGGPLCGYRWSGESVLSADNFCVTGS